MPGSTASSLKVVYVMAVWGRAYIEKFVTIALPTLLAPGNLVRAAARVPSRFLLVTSAGDVPALEADPLVRHLKSIVDVVFMTFDPASNPGTALARSHLLAARSAAENAEAGVFLAPDAIFSDGSLDHIVSLAVNGARAVMSTGLRVVEETSAPALAGMPRDGNGAVVLPARAMAAFGLARLHPEIRHYVWTVPDFTDVPHLCMWPGPDQDGFLIRAFHLHPLLVDFRGVHDVQAFEHTTIDGDFVGQLIGRWSDIHIVDDSDDLVVYSLTPLNDRPPCSSHGPATLDAVRAMAYRPDVNPLHRYFFAHPIRLHAGDLDSRWIALEDETGLVAYSALDLTAGNGVAHLAGIMDGRVLLRFLLKKIGSRLAAAGPARRPPVAGPGRGPR